MRFMLMFRSDRPPEAGESACRSQLPEMAKLMGQLRESGVLLATEGLLPSDRGARVRMNGGKVSVMDGPFAETKELIAGFAVVQVGSKAEAVELAKRFLAIAGGGESDILEVFEPDAVHAAR